MQTPLLALVLLVASSMAASSVAHAQPLPPDLVELANGGMVRGTIIENLPGDHVTIQLSTGEMRRFPSAEVRSAGPAPTTSLAVPPPPPGAPVLAQPGASYGPSMAPRPTVRVHVEATSEQLTLQEITGTATALVGTRYGFTTVALDQFAPLCTAPCDTQLEPRTYRLGVSLGQGQARRADHNLFTIDRDVSLELDYESREGARIAGWIVFIGGAIAGAGIMLGGILGNTRDFIDWIIAGTVTLAVAEIIGLALAFLNDHVDIRTIEAALREPGVRF